MIRASAPVQSLSHQTRQFDLQSIDTPEEALLMPGADLWVGLYLGPLEGRVSVSVDDQHLFYESKFEDNKLEYTGTLNGEAFELEAKSARPRGIHLRGETPGGVIDSLRRGGGGGFGLDGTVGSVDFSQLLALSRNPDDGQLAFLGGTVGGEEFEARVKKGEDNTVQVNGHLGEQEVKQTIRVGPNDEWLIQGSIGEHDYTQIIERT